MSGRAQSRPTKSWNYKCTDGLTYTGITGNMDRRFAEHQNGTNKMAFTYRRRPVQLIFQQEFNDVLQAISFEKRIKKWSAKKKFALAAGDMDLLQILSEGRNASHHKFNPNQDWGLDCARPDKPQFVSNLHPSPYNFYLLFTTEYSHASSKGFARFFSRA